MAWRLDGTYFENCSCEVACPCTVSDFAAAADYERCQFLMAFHVDSGKVDGVDVADLTVGVFGDTPQMMIQGSWRVGLFIDDKASEEQAAKLTGVFSGQMGGPMAGLAPLITEMLGIERKRMDYTADGRRHRIKIGDGVDMRAEDLVSPLDPEGDGPKLANVHHPANGTLTVAQSSSSHIAAFGVDITLDGKSAFSSPFSWAG